MAEQFGLQNPTVRVRQKRAYCENWFLTRKHSSAKRFFQSTQSYFWLSSSLGDKSSASSDVSCISSASFGILFFYCRKYDIPVPL
jgi:hypothetical protein